jgi:hypothetical protein
LKTLLSELHFLPSIASFCYFKAADEILLEACENYQKGSYRNRCYIVGANGLQRLSIPLEKGKNNQLLIREVALNFHQDWPRQHWQSIRSAYGNAPFFPYYADELMPIFIDPPALLWDFNLAFLKTIFRLLQWDKPIHTTKEFRTQHEENIYDIRQKVTPKFYPPNGTYQENFTAYPQVFRERHGFMANLSILDLLFCQGPQANLYLSENYSS